MRSGLCELIRRHSPPSFELSADNISELSDECFLEMFLSLGIPQTVSVPQCFDADDSAFNPTPSTPSLALQAAKKRLAFYSNCPYKFASDPVLGVNIALQLPETSDLHIQVVTNLVFTSWHRSLKLDLLIVLEQIDRSFQARNQPRSLSVDLIYSLIIGVCVLAASTGQHQSRYTPGVLPAPYKDTPGLLLAPYKELMACPQVVLTLECFLSAVVFPARFGPLRR